jgi:hypothetical protein
MQVLQHRAYSCSRLQLRKLGHRKLLLVQQTAYVTDSPKATKGSIRWLEFLRKCVSNRRADGACLPGSMSALSPWCHLHYIFGHDEDRWLIYQREIRETTTER